MTGQVASVRVCAEFSPGVGAAAVDDASCPVGLQGYQVDAYLVAPESMDSFLAAIAPLDVAELTFAFGWGFSTVMFFFLLGAIGHPFLATFWKSR